MKIYPQYATLNTPQASGADYTLSSTNVVGIDVLAFRKGNQSTPTRVNSATGTAQVSTVEWVSIVNSTTYQLALTFFNPVTKDIVTQYFNYTSISGGAGVAQAAAQVAFLAWCNAIIANSGYVAATSGTTTTITCPKNQYFNIVLTIPLGSIDIVCTASVPVPQVGLGSDLIYTYNIPVASSSSANDGLTPTALYSVLTIPFKHIDSRGNVNLYSYMIFGNDTTFASRVTDLFNTIQAAL